MENNRKIRIISSQLAGEDKETVIVDTDAEISGNAGDYTISYIESQGDCAGEETCLHVRDARKITIRRRNNNAAPFIILEKGIRHITHYSVSSCSSFNMGMSCSVIESDFEGVRLFFRYETDVELVPIGEIEFEILFGKTEV